MQSLLSLLLQLQAQPFGMSVTTKDSASRNSSSFLLIDLQNALNSPV